jgi:hypothetical protein
MVTPSVAETLGTLAAEKAVAEAVTTPPTEFTTSAGVVFKLKPVAPFLIRRAMNSVPIPQPPIVFIEAKGREEANPNDPGYLAALEDREAASSEAIMRATLLAGSAVKSIPAGVEPVESDEWVEMVEAAEIGSVLVGTKAQRYLSWVQFVGCPTLEDLQGLMNAIGRLMGIVAEVDVEQSIDSFRGDEGRPGSNGSAAHSPTPDGPGLPASDAGPSAGS